MENPFQEDPKNQFIPRVITHNVEKTPKVAVGTAALYAFTLLAYNRRFFRIDGNAVAAGAFAAFSLPASYAYARFFLSNPENEAALLNNAREGKE